MRQLVETTLFVTLALAGVVWLSQSLRFVDLIVNRGLSIFTFLHLTILLLPSFLGIILPIALFCAVVYTYNRLIVDSEIVVLRSAGMSQLDLARPALMLAGVVTLACYAITLYFMPLGFREFKDRQFLIRGDYSHLMLQEGTFNSIGSGITVYVRAHQPNGEVLGILVHDNRDPDRPVTMMAERGALVSTPAGPRFLLINGNRQEMRRGDRKLGLLYFDRYSFDLSSIVAGETTRWREPRERFLHELFGPPQGIDDRLARDRLLAEGHQRLVSPLFALAFALIGLATVLSGEFSRRGRLPRMLFGAGAAIVFQGLGLALVNMVAKLPLLTPAIYVYVAVWSVAGLLVLLRRPGTYRQVIPPGFEAGAV